MSPFQSDETCTKGESGYGTSALRTSAPYSCTTKGNNTTHKKKKNRKKKKYTVERKKKKLEGS